MGQSSFEKPLTKLMQKCQEGIRPLSIISTFGQYKSLSDRKYWSIGIDNFKVKTSDKNSGLGWVKPKCLIPDWLLISEKLSNCRQNNNSEASVSFNLSNSYPKIPVQQRQKQILIFLKLCKNLGLKMSSGQEGDKGGEGKEEKAWVNILPNARVGGVEW